MSITDPIRGLGAQDGGRVASGGGGGGKRQEVAATRAKSGRPQKTELRELLAPEIGPGSMPNATVVGPTPAAPEIPILMTHFEPQDPTPEKIWEFGEFWKLRVFRKSPENHREKGGGYGAPGGPLPEPRKLRYASC